MRYVFPIFFYQTVLIHFVQNFEGQCCVTLPFSAVSCHKYTCEYTSLRQLQFLPHCPLRVREKELHHTKQQVKLKCFQL
jgi:hypothetical protein